MFLARDNFKRWIKKILKRIPIAFSKNHRYDLETRKIIRRICNHDSNCIDVGTHEGEILDIFLKYSPEGTHFAFEPLPYLYQYLTKKYNKSKKVHVYDFALSNSEGPSEFNYVVSNPAYSGLKKRMYDRKNERDTKIEVRKQLLDNIVPPDVSIAMIKLDVEGGEMDVLQGAVKTLMRNKPALLFEFGIGGSDRYGATPEKLYEFLGKLNYNVFVLGDFLKNRNPLSIQDFKKQFYHKINYYFFAY